MLDLSFLRDKSKQPVCEFHNIPMVWEDAGQGGISEWQCPKCEEEFVEEFEELTREE